MLQPWKSAASVIIPIHIIFERRASDNYKLEENALPSTSLLPTGMRLWESRDSDVYEPGESRLRAPPCSLNKSSPASTEPLLKSDMVEQAENTEEIEPETQAAAVGLTRVQFRQATIEVDNPEVFWDGVVGGQVAAVEEQQPLSGAQVFALFEDAVRDLEFSETWLAGYLLGLGDALLRQRKMYPRAYTALLKPLK